MQSLDFDSLNEAQGSEAWCNTFAYWLLVLKDPRNVYAREAKEACAAMSFQFDVEDQARDIEMLISDAELIPSVFIPIAPVTLALQWSPFPAAIKALGPQRHLDTKAGKVLAVFNPSAQPKLVGLSPDEQHFAFLIRHVCKRAIELNSLVLLVGSPGWDYESEDSIDGQPDLQNLMREFGFVYTHRKPVEG
ncbi:hypothetical protein MON38_15990 [Hymenobacter sp. DH14]|uniref:Uncharacterized protein n=1 Tax=Hymenobacter cyanobacteriorum TaxID=2926463 RepID=A0A9X1VGT4_9BACT|nr:hypothetical protein [Hymenobacter cyanobacteriorum]MCI1188924.1 hypothetical protein [Hymenobacter cyanobacteriorum]